jgi:hypothetical protein
MGAGIEAFADVGIFDIVPETPPRLPCGLPDHARADNIDVQA